MVAYFPTPYPDELLYSVLARNSRHTGLPPDALVNVEILGKRHAIPSFDLPFGLKNLAALIPSVKEFSAKYLLIHRTAFNYLVAFATPVMAKQATKSVLKGKVTDWYLKLGMAAFRVPRVTRLRFCAECNSDMLNTYGEMYWKREFQLPSVVVCRTHQTSLYKSSIDIKLLRRHAFYAADALCCVVKPETKLVSSEITELGMLRLVSIAKRSAALLEINGEHKTHGGWTTYYRRQLEHTGFANYQGHVKRKKLHAAVSSFYGDMFKSVPDFRQLIGLNWLSLLTRKHRHAIHPLHHLLLEEFLADQALQLPFGSGPWVCMNPLAGHFNQYTINHFLVHNNHGHHVAVFKCTCGYTYTQWLDPNTGEIGPKRFYAFGPLLNTALQDFISQGTGLRDIGRRLNIDPKTVIKLATDLGVPHPWKVNKSKSIVVNPPKLKIHKVTKAREYINGKLDWKTIDADLKKAVQSEVRRIRKVTPPIKLTLSAIERGLGRTGWIGRRKAKLPLTTQYLKSKIEKHSEFRLRKLIWAIKELKANLRSVAPTNVVKYAGLRHDAFKVAQPKLIKYLH